ncbi:Ribokinase [Candidatus Desulfarcum epimagneticum]|uniref:Ribokinase n=1 Tax=uncultured Desulfobacteraceae bacterium TaxID=218296 RepID=A0A484HKU5_9BACT|nr:Ribokinase [uncultured Desulfobacteraceae bacterium]
MSETTEKWAAAAGSALIDILIRENDAFLEKIGAVKGGMKLVDEQTIEKALAMTPARPEIVPGGSACNTACGIGKLGGRVRFLGKCGDDEMGRLFEKGLEKNQTRPDMVRSPSSSTGRVLSIITPDAQRSMLTFLGASAETRPDEMTPKRFENAAIVHLEGYMMFNPDLMEAALKAASASGARVSLDLASFTVVEESRDALIRLTEKYVDIVMANEDEARVFSGENDETAALEWMGEKAGVAALKVGERGSLISARGKIIPVAPAGDGESALDTTGAGDLWASGFLYGLLNGLPIEKCGELGSRCGFEACRVVGAHIPEDRWKDIRKIL